MPSDIADTVPSPPPPRRNGNGANGGGARATEVLGAFAGLGGPGIKLAAIGALLLLMLIPHAQVAGVIEERADRQQEARADIARSWGPAQAALGPVLVIPFRKPVTRYESLPNGGNKAVQEVQRDALVLLPTALRGGASLQPETRRRGLFAGVVYRGHVDFTGSFTLPALLNQEPDTEFLWNEAYVLAGSTSQRALAAQAKLAWNGQAVPAADALGGDVRCGGADLIRWNVPLGNGAAAPTAGRSVPFAAALDLRGTGSFRMLPLARQAELRVSAPWPTPSFGGSSLPVRSDVNAAGFEAEFADGSGGPLLRAAASLCNGFRGAEADGSDGERADARIDYGANLAGGPGIGVELLEAVPTYRMVNRASKYAVLFLALTFLTYVLFELVARVRIHLVQYGLLGLSIVLFPLLLLAFGEPLGFATAYGISSAAILAQAGLFTLSVTRSARLAGVFTGLLGALFGFLYVVLNLEAYALLTGAVALFAVLSLVMALSRRMEWGS